MTDKLKDIAVGDRVKIEFEATVAAVGANVNVSVPGDDQHWFLAPTVAHPSFSIRKIEAPLRKGDWVRDRAGEKWMIIATPLDNDCSGAAVHQYAVWNKYAGYGSLSAGDLTRVEASQ